MIDIIHKMRPKTVWGPIVFLVGAVICGSMAGLFVGFTRDLPQIRSLESFSPSAVTRLLSSEGVLLAEIYLEKRDPVELGRIPQRLVDALLATEDRKFFKHSGVDLKAVLRAIVKDIWAGEFVEGASTLTQQLAKTLFLTPRKTLVRKIKEAVLAFQLERRYTKDEILTLYLNQVYFGSGAYGVSSAARIFFDKSVEELNLAECALIAGMPKSPTRYSPLINPQLAVSRRNVVLRQLRDVGTISALEYQQAVQTPLQVAVKPQQQILAPYFVAYLKDQLEDIVGPDRLYKGGLTVHTTLSLGLQKAAEKAVRDGVANLRKRMRRNNLPNPQPQGALISLSVKSGGILAMVGGDDFQQSPFNRATHARRQPGSAFKPIVYAHAIERGFSQNRLILDAPVVFRGAKKGQDWRPQNFSKSFAGEITLRKALTHSKNIPAVRLIEMLGPVSVSEFAHRLGIRSPLSPNLSLALGTSEVSLMELTAAYAVFANYGQWIRPYGMTEILDRNGRQLWRVKPHKRLAMSRAGAAVITDILKGVIEEGTGRRARGLNRNLAGKTGTTNDYHDALFVGFSPAVATGVWTGQDRFETLGPGETGARAALPIWIDYMRRALEMRPYEYFDIPDQVVRRAIDPHTGEPLPESAPNAVVALFRTDGDSNSLKRQ